MSGDRWSRSVPGRSPATRRDRSGSGRHARRRGPRRVRAVRRCRLRPDGRAVRGRRAPGGRRAGGPRRRRRHRGGVGQRRREADDRAGRCGRPVRSRRPAAASPSGSSTDHRAAATATTGPHGSGRTPAVSHGSRTTAGRAAMRRSWSARWPRSRASLYAATWEEGPAPRGRVYRLRRCHVDRLRLAVGRERRDPARGARGCAVRGHLAPEGWGIRPRGLRQPAAGRTDPALRGRRPLVRHGPARRRRLGHGAGDVRRLPVRGPDVPGGPVPVRRAGDVDVVRDARAAPAGPRRPRRRAVRRRQRPRARRQRDRPDEGRRGRSRRASRRRRRRLPLRRRRPVDEPRAPAGHDPAVLDRDVWRPDVHRDVADRASSSGPTGSTPPGDAAWDSVGPARRRDRDHEPAGVQRDAVRRDPPARPALPLRRRRRVGAPRDARRHARRPVPPGGVDGRVRWRGCSWARCPPRASTRCRPAPWRRTTDPCPRAGTTLPASGMAARRRSTSTDAPVGTGEADLARSDALATGRHRSLVGGGSRAGFEGELSDVRVWDRALGREEIASLGTSVPGPRPTRRAAHIARSCPPAASAIRSTSSRGHSQPSAASPVGTPDVAAYAAHAAPATSG